MAWLNSNVVFKERAIAYLETVNGSNAPATTGTEKLSIRTRGLETAQPSIQVMSSPASMFTDNAMKVIGAANQARIRATLASTDPKANFTDATYIRYTLDKVDDLAPGTYVVSIEFADASRGPGNAPEPPYTDYRTPTVKVVPFQVKQAAKEKPIAANCDACHWSGETATNPGAGFVLDNPRHNKLFNSQALDQCRACHDYQSGMIPGATASSWSGGAPISKRVHAVHNGSALNYPTITVAHEETASYGRNWRITFPMDIRNCEACHPANTTSGTWQTNPNRLACMGCHDSDAATAHMKLMAVDPTPNAPWSGDEQETCKACHQ